MDLEVTPEILETIDKVCRRLSYKFKFGYHSAEDMQQEATIFALQSLDKWDGIRPLENFLQRCVHNRLFNFKRNNYQRPEKPCEACPLYQPGVGNECSEFVDKMCCEPYSKWYEKNNSKKNIIQPTDISNIRDENENNMKVNNLTSEVENSELLLLIDQHLDIKLRADYIKMKDGLKIPKHRRLKVEEAVLLIIEEYNVS